ncbi:hypothetical protein [Symbiobacterium terraclitae]|uniref:hypothetical protein n=1 Tax=Symbiobacterium terraclitae TaxID=557451 RepID=UPI0035B51EEB
MATRGRPQKPWQNQLPPGLFDDTAFCTLDPLQRLLLLALIARADRHGRGSAKASVLRVAAFDGLPVGDDQVEAMLQGLVSLMAGSVYELTVYTVDRNDYYAFLRWHEFQNIDYVPKTSRFPAPPDYPDPEPPTPPRGHPDGSADLPTETGAPATVPTRGETPAAEQRDQGPAADPQESADLSAVERARRSPEYREYEATCRDGELDRWLAPLAFEQLFGELVRRGIDDWTVLIEVAREAARSAGGARAPNVRYGVRIIQELPPGIKTREQARAHFERPRDKPTQASGGTERPTRSSNVILKRGPKPPGYYDDVFKRFDDDDQPEGSHDGGLYAGEDARGGAAS